MKRFLLSFFITLLSVGLLYAQSPDMFNYQAVARDGQGNVIANQSIGIKISILQGSANGIAVYEEEHTASTTDQGVLNLLIGDGSVLSGTFADINWKSGTYFLEIGMDASGGTSYTTMGTTQLVSVPYAKYADSSGTSFSGNYNDLSNTPDFTDWDQNVNDDFSGDYGDLSNKLWMNNNDTIFTNGALGIGTDSLSGDFTIQGTGQPNDLSIRDNLAFMEVDASSGNAGITFSSNGVQQSFLYFNPSSNNMILTSPGNVGINTSLPSETLDVNGALRVRTTTGSPASGRIYGNSVPLAYGQVNATGVLAAGSYGIASVSNTSTGVYEITFDNSFTDYATFSITSYAASSPEVATYVPDYASNTVTVHIWALDGTHQGSAFSIVVYGTPQGAKKNSQNEKIDKKLVKPNYIQD